MEKLLPLLIFLICPIMHLLMMRGHKGQHSTCHQSGKTQEKNLPASNVLPEK